MHKETTKKIITIHKIKQVFWGVFFYQNKSSVAL